MGVGGARGEGCASTGAGDIRGLRPGVPGEAGSAVPVELACDDDLEWFTPLIGFEVPFWAGGEAGGAIIVYVRFESVGKRVGMTYGVSLQLYFRPHSKVRLS